MKKLIFALFFCSLMTFSFIFADDTPQPRAVLSYEQLQQNFAEQNIHAELPQVPTTIDSLENFSTQAILRLEKTVNSIAKLDFGDLSFNKVVLRFDRALMQYHESISIVAFAGSIAKNLPIYSVSEKLQKNMLDKLDKVFLRSDLLEKIEFFKKTGNFQKNGNESRLIEELLSSFAKKKKFSEMICDSKLSGLYATLQEKEFAFVESVKRKSDSFIYFSQEELRGVSSQVLDKIPRELKKYKVALTDADHLYSIHLEAELPETREKASSVWRSNVDSVALELLRDITGLRRIIASETGYSSWADSQMDGFSVTASSLSRELHQFLNRTDAKFLDLKKKLKVQTEAELVYQLNRIEKNFLPENISEYFEFSHTVEEVLRISEDLFSVDFVEIEDGPTWHESVRTLAVRDHSTGQWLGVFYLDLFQREGKDSGAWYNDLRFADPGSKNKRKNRPVGIVNAYFRMSQDGSPTLLGWDDVQVFTHELGHALDSMFTNNGYYHLGYRANLGEFAEFPSTFLETYITEPSVLRRLAKHFKSGERWTEAYVEEMLSSRSFSKLWIFRKDAVASLLDLQLHRSRGRDPKALENQYFQEYLFPLAEGYSFLSTFDHLTGDYDSRYWTYLWSKAISHRLAAEAALDPRKVGLKIRNALASKGDYKSNREFFDQIVEKQKSLCSMLSEVFR